MSEATETIFACDCSGKWLDDSGVWGPDRENTFDVEYRRADLPATDEQAFANEKVKDLLIDVGSSLVAAVSLLKSGGKKAAPSDKMFEQMLTDYEGSVGRLREALAAMEEDNA